jgi:hypothetical protein
MVGYYTIPRTPSSVLTTLTCDSIRPGQQNRNPSFFWDRRVDAQIAQALKMQITDPDAAVRVWAGLESELVGLAPGCRSTRRGRVTSSPNAWGTTSTTQPTKSSTTSCGCDSGPRARGNLSPRPCRPRSLLRTDRAHGTRPRREREQHRRLRTYNRHDRNKRIRRHRLPQVGRHSPKSPGGLHRQTCAQTSAQPCALRITELQALHLRD